MDAPRYQLNILKDFKIVQLKLNNYRKRFGLGLAFCKLAIEK